MMTEARTGMFWVIATLAIAILPQLAGMPPQLVPVVLLPMGWRLAAEFRGWKPAPTPVRVAVTIIATFILVVTYGSLIGRHAAVSMLILMLSLKLLETFRVRDARIVASLSLFVCGTQFLFSQGLPMLAYTIGVVIASLVSLLLLQRRDAFQPTGKAPPRGHSLFSEFGYSFRLLAVSVPVAIVLFLFFPRWGSPLWGMPEASLDAKTGLSDSMSPGSIQNLFMDDSPAFRADFASPLPGPNNMYWRGPVFWEFDGESWRSTYYSRALPAVEMPDPAPDSWRYAVQMEPTEQRWIFALDYPAVKPPRVSLTMDYQMLSRRPITQLVSYDMVSNPRFVDSPRLLNTHRANATRLPEGFNPRTRELVERWRGVTPEDGEFVNRALRFFNEEAFVYSLNPPLLSRHTVDEFLFETRSGFCEHYASAFTVMMRMAGIPARVVTGYQGGWYNALGNYVLVRQSDAHAWSEVWLPGSGWTRVDPTAAVAPGRIESGALQALAAKRHLLDFQWLRQFRNGFDLLQRGWNNWVLAFDAERQMKLLMPIGFGELDARKLVLVMLLAIALLGLLMWPLLMRVRLPAGTDPVARQWARFRRKLAAAGIETTAAMTPGELEHAAGAALHGQGEEIARIAGLYRAIRYAPDGPPVADLKAAVGGFEPERKRRGTRA